MRLDKYLSEAAVCSRRDAARAAKACEVTVDGEVVRDPSVHIDPETAEVSFCGSPVSWKRFTYVMLNKPEGVISSTEDSGRTVMDVLPPECRKKNMFPCGRLDIDTTGLLLITNDGECAHMLLSPSRHVEKTYAFECSFPIGDSEREALERGVDIGGSVTSPSVLRLDSPTTGKITVTEGKYHQIKRMFHAVGSEIVSLERVSFGPLTLDPSLARGEFRYLTAEEEEALLRAAKKQ
ncbi:MAG: rRNA pseudouridine synthase [Clostridia bacterium]|nr:rRNA pseudouridine synthase [Clostridia bacterium]